VAPLLGGAALIAIAVVVEARSPAPLIPLRFFTNRTRVGANLVSLIDAATFIPYFYLLTLFEQQVLHYSPLHGGLSYLPLGVGLSVGIGLGTALMPRLAVKPLLTAAPLGMAAGLALTSGIGIGTSYAGGILPGMLVLAVFVGMGFPALTNAALHQVTGQDSSLAAGVQSATQAVGGALGVACLVTLALRQTDSQVTNGVLPNIAATHGYALSLRIGAVLLAASALLVVITLEKVTAQPQIT